MEKENCLICECHLISWDDLEQIFQELKPVGETSLRLTQVADLKKYQILGHGCGQCLKTWEHELGQFFNQRLET